MRIRRATIRGDSIIGVQDAPGDPTVSIPTARVRRLETRQLEGDRTAALVVGVGLGVLLLAAIATAVFLAAVFGGGEVSAH